MLLALPFRPTHPLTSKDVDRFRGYRCDRRHNSGSLSVVHETTPPLPVAVVRQAKSMLLVRDGPPLPAALVRREIGRLFCR